MTRRPLIAGNWKMHKTAAEAAKMLTELKKLISEHPPQAEALICPPFTAIATASSILAGTPVEIGAQNVHAQKQGAFTGEVSAPMLQELGVTYVILGHSERRTLFGEKDEHIAAKIEAVLGENLNPILCVGESLTEREAGLTDQVIIVQLQRALGNIAPVTLNNLVVAYEPVWAIGTGKTCDSLEANRVCKLIREFLGTLLTPEVAAGVRILYGGSVKPETIAEQMAQSDIDGALVGGASLDAASFAKLLTLGA
jgi:triosephosphate isomerase (TIM)